MVAGRLQRILGLGFGLAVIFICCVALAVPRSREPGAARPFRAWGYPWSAAVVVLGAAAFLAAAVVTDTRNAAAALGLAAVGLPVRALCRRGS